MKGAGRLGDLARAEADSHGCPACPHPVTGRAISGSPNVLFEDKPALRLGDTGLHAACCGTNTWRAIRGAPGVFINDKPVHRIGDATQHCGGNGKLSTGSRTILVGDEAEDNEHLHQAKLEVRIAHAGGDPLAHEPYEVLDREGNIVASGELDADGWLRVEDIEWGEYSVRLKHGWHLRNDE